ncbi:hypothetical protein BASA81_001263 [Batrachochytrium salamandrivorans]|nr:hypothetical protein BASA81_001263 [Batrachochytrium salamandrivorans]
MPIVPSSFRSGQNIQDLEGRNGLLVEAQRVDTLSSEEQQKHFKYFEKADPLQLDVLNLFYSYVRLYPQLSVKAQPKVSQLLCFVLKSLFQGEQQPHDQDEEELKREKIKYYVYFLVYLIRDQEKREAELAGAPNAKKKKASKQQQGEDGEGGEDNDDTMQGTGNGGGDDHEEGEEDGKKQSNSVWALEREKCLDALLAVLATGNLGRVFDSGVPDENFLTLFSKVGEAVLERGLSVVRSGTRIREIAMTLIITPTHLFHDSVGHGVASLLWNFIRQHTFGPQLVVELLVLSQTKFNEERLALDLIQQLGEDSGGGEENAESSTTAAATTHKNVAVLVEQLSKAMPVLLKNNLSLLLPYLNQKESYPMRCAIIKSLAFLVEHLHGGGKQLTAGTTELKILDTLADWAHDISPYVRASVAQAWNHLVETKSLPLSHVLVALSIALDGTRDKKVIVRKHSLALVENLLAQNCFGPELRLGPFASEAEVRKLELEQILERQEQTEEELDEQTEKRRKVLYESLQFLKTCLLFITHLEKSIPYLCHLLTSKTDDDVLGTIRFFATAKQFKLEKSEVGVRAMLKLVWGSDKVKKVLMETVERLYVAKTETPTKRVLYPEIASNLVELAQHANQDELTSLAEVVSEMRRGADSAVLKRTILPNSAVEDLWPIILGGNFPRARAALSVLGMAATTSPQMVDVAPNSSKLLQAAFNGRARERRDFEFAKLAFQVLGSAAKARGEGGQCLLEREERNLVELEGIHLICGKWPVDFEFERKAWFGATQAALDLMADLGGGRPDKTYLFILERLFETSKNKSHSDSNALCDLLFVSGHIAIKLQILAENRVQQIKRIKQKQMGRNKEEEEMLGASAEDEAEDLLLRQFGDQDLLQEDTVLGVCCEWAQRLAMAKPTSVPPLLRHCAVMALCKFMTVSERVCEENLSLVFTVLRDEVNADTRSVIVIALGDLAFRFPNAVEPFTSEMYKALRDGQVSVRKNALMVLTHLALNDMIKVRGEVSEIAMRIEDEDKSMRDLARFFFCEIAKRGTNPIYHLLPDIFGSLSRESPAVLGPHKFRALAKFLIEFVDKEKQCESLAEKLCHRIHATCGSVTDVVVPSQLAEFQICRDLCFCLEQLKCSDTLLKRINDDSDLFKCLAPILGDKEVYTSVSRLVGKANPKNQDAKRNLEEVEEKLDRLYQNQSSDIASYEKASGVRGKATGKTVALRRRSSNSLLPEAKKTLVAPKSATAPRSAAKRGKTKKIVVEKSESEEASSSEEELPLPRKPPTTSSRKRVVKD